MMYLTVTDAVNEYNIVHYTFIRCNKRSGETFLCDTPAYTCIIDIDDVDACALKLKGIPLFKVKSISKKPYLVHGMLGEFDKVNLVDKKAVTDWWDSL